MEASYEKQMIMNHLPLPRDVIDNEIKSYVFYDKISGESKRKKQIMNEKFKMTILSTRSNFFGSQNEIDSHWAIGFGDHADQNVQLQANNCERCGNYLLFGSMFSFTQSQIGKITCQCILNQDNPVEIIWDEQEEQIQQESQGDDEYMEHYDDEDLVQDAAWDEEYSV